MRANRKPQETRAESPIASVPIQYPHWIDPRDYWSSNYPWRTGFSHSVQASLHRPPCIM